MSAINQRRAVFLDRDGTLIEEKCYLSDPRQVVLFAGAAAALRRLREAGFLLFVVSNQSGVGRGYFTMDDVERVNARVAELLALEGAWLDKVYIAPEAPGQPSRGRKPSPAFLFDARDEFNLDLPGSYVIGDKLIDLECGMNAGVAHVLLVRTGYGLEVEKSNLPILHKAQVVNDLPAAAEWILRKF